MARAKRRERRPHGGGPGEPEDPPAGPPNLLLAAFVGFEVISKVPNTLHTPLMSVTNAIHGIVLLGGLLLVGAAGGFLNKLLLVIAIAFGTINIVGGFLVTDRMLHMFQRRPEPR